MDRITDAFVWPVRDPEWPAEIGIIGLILLIPIVGSINGLGWMLAALDGLRAGEERLPPANLSYLGRGLRLFVVNFVYYFAIFVVAAAVYAAGVVIPANPGQGESQPVLGSLGLALLFLGFSPLSLGFLAPTFLTPPILLPVSHVGHPRG